MKRQKSETISFRLPPDLDGDLQDAAIALGISKHEYARMLVFHALRHSGAAAAGDRVDEIAGSVRKLGDDLALVAKALLVKVGKYDEAKVDEWLRQNQLGDPRGGP